MAKTCSCPGCIDDATFAVTAQNAGSHTGETFYTCDRHARKDDDRVRLD